MIELDAVVQRWSAAWSGDADPWSLPAHEARALVERAVTDLHDLVRLAVEVRAYGRARVALSEAHEAWVAAGKPEAGPTRDDWHEARAAHRAALDRIEAIAVQLAGGDVERVTGGAS